MFGGNRIQQWISSWGKLLPKFVKPHTISFWSNSQLALEFNRELLWFCFSSFYNWSKKITPLYQPIKFKTKPSRVLVDRVFPRCWLLTYFYFDFSLTPQPIKFKTKTSRVLVDRVFPRCRKLTYFYSDFSLTPQPIKLKTKTNRVFVERVFPRFAQLTCVYFDFSLVPQPIKFKTKTSRVLVDHVFPRFRQLTYFYFDFSLALSDVSLLWLVVQIFLGLYFTTLNGHALHLNLFGWKSITSALIGKAVVAYFSICVWKVSQNLRQP